MNQEDRFSIIQDVWNKTKDDSSIITRQEIREAMLLTEIKARLEAPTILNERIKRIEEAATKLLNKIDIIINSDAYKNVFVIAAIHNCPYRGQNFETERNELLDALNQK